METCAMCAGRQAGTGGGWRAVARGPHLLLEADKGGDAGLEEGPKDAVRLLVTQTRRVGTRQYLRRKRFAQPSTRRQGTGRRIGRVLTRSLMAQLHHGVIPRISRAGGLGSGGSLKAACPDAGWVMKTLPRLLTQQLGHSRSNRPKDTI